MPLTARTAPERGWLRPTRLIPVLLAVVAVSCREPEQSPPSAPSATAPPPASKPAAPVEIQIDGVSSPQWEDDMRMFAAADAATPPPAHPVVFTGSSSIRMWDLAADFPGVPVLNRGFGGSQLRDAVWHADQVAIRYRPRMLLLYAGDNDLAAGRSPEQVLTDFRAFVARIRRDLPDVPIAYISIKPSPSRAQLLPRMREANDLIRAEAAKMGRVTFIDVFTPMLGADGKPRPELYIEDELHMNRAGYELWRGIVAPYVGASR